MDEVFSGHSSYYNENTLPASGCENGDFLPLGSTGLTGVNFTLLSHFWAEARDHSKSKCSLEHPLPPSFCASRTLYIDSPKAVTWSENNGQIWKISTWMKKKIKWSRYKHASWSIRNIFNSTDCLFSWNSHRLMLSVKLIVRMLKIHYPRESH